MIKLLEYLRPYYLRMLLGFIIKFFGTIMDLCLPLILAYILDYIIPLNNLNLIFLYGLLMLVCSILALVTNILANQSASYVALKCTKDLRKDLFAKTIYLSNQQLDEISIPSLISRLTSDTYNIHQLIGMMQRVGVRAPLLLVGGIIVTFFLEPVLTLILLGTVPLMFMIIYFISKNGIPKFKNAQKQLDNLVRVVRENITGVRVIRALSTSDIENKRFISNNDELIKKEKEAALIMALNSPLISLTLNIGLVIVILVSSYRIELGLTKIGSVVAFMSFFMIILNAVIIVTRLFIVYSKASASLDRIVAVLNLDTNYLVREFKEREEDYHIIFDHVSFSYNGNKENLKDLSFKLKKGQSLGILGTTGSGKTTIVNLLMRYYDVDKGAILINGKDLRSMKLEEIRSRFGVVFQNDTIFTSTLLDNIKFYRDINAEQIEKAIKISQANDVIASKEKGLEEKMHNRGANLSGGQKQRILIARALATDPEVLILDDSSSALDYKTDANLRKGIKDNFASTLIIIAQRISSIKDCDQIIVLDEGEVVGQGNHEELIANCSLYQKILDNQMGIGEGND